MQRLKKLYEPTYRDIDDFNEKYLDKGWTVKNMIPIEKILIILLEKDTRKEKLEELDKIKQS